MEATASEHTVMEGFIGQTLASVSCCPSVVAPFGIGIPHLCTSTERTAIVSGSEDPFMRVFYVENINISRRRARGIPYTAFMHLSCRAKIASPLSSLLPPSAPRTVLWG